MTFTTLIILVTQLLEVSKLPMAFLKLMLRLNTRVKHIKLFLFLC